MSNSYFSRCPSADFDHRQRRGKGAARHDVLRPDRFVLVVEIREVPGQHVHRAHRKACSLFVEQREIDQLFERLTQRCTVIVARGALSPGKAEPWGWMARREEPGLALDQSHP